MKAEENNTGGEGRERPAGPLPWLWRPRTWMILWAAWLAALCVLSSMSQPGPKIDLSGVDKVEHAVYFCAGGACLALAAALRAGGSDPQTALALPRRWWWKVALLVVLASAVVGWLDEWHQSFTPGRFGLDPWDWLADVTGGALAVPPARLFLRRVLARKR